MWTRQELWSNNPTHQNRGKVKNILFKNPKEELKSEYALNLMFNYFDKKNQDMQTQIYKNVEPRAKKFKKPDRLDIKGKDNKNHRNLFCYKRMLTVNIDR